MYGFCLVSLNNEETQHLLVGGRMSNAATDKTWRYDWKASSPAWIDAGRLGMNLLKHKCVRTKLQDESSIVSHFSIVLTEP